MIVNSDYPNSNLPQLLRIKVFVNCEIDKKILTHIQGKLTSYLGISLVRCYNLIQIKQKKYYSSKQEEDIVPWLILIL